MEIVVTPFPSSSAGNSVIQVLPPRLCVSTPLSNPPTLTAFKQPAGVIRRFRSDATKNRHHKHSRTCTVKAHPYSGVFPMEPFGLPPIPRLKATMYFVREKVPNGKVHRRSWDIFGDFSGSLAREICTGS